MRYFRDRAMWLSWGTSINIDARQFTLALIPRRDLTPPGYSAYCAIRLDLIWPHIDRYLGRWWPRVVVTSDAATISRLIAERAGQIA